MDRGKGAEGREGRERGRLGRLAWAPGILQWGAAQHSPSLDQWASLVRSLRPLWRQSGARRGHFAVSGRVAVLSVFAFSLVQPGSRQDPFPEDSEVRSCPAPRVARIQLGSAVSSRLRGGGAVHSHQCPFPCVQGRRAQRGEGEHPWLSHWGLEGDKDRSSCDHLDPRGSPPAAVPSFCESRQHCVPDGSYLLPQTVQEEKAHSFNSKV